VARGANGSTVITHTEFISDVITSSTAGEFHAVTKVINPGNAQLFPWLSTLSRSYESYRFLSCRFNYEPSVPTSTAGVVQMAVDYDPVDVAPSSKMELMSNHHSVRASAYTAASYTIDQKDANNFGARRYIRSGTLTGNALYDIGTLIVATSGFAGTSVTAGELYVTYSIELITPQLDLSTAAHSGSAILSVSSGVSKDAPFGTAITVSGGLSIHRVGPTSIQIDTPGEYFFDIYLEGTGLSAVVTAAAAPSPSLTANIYAITGLSEITKNWNLRVVCRAPSTVLTLNTSAVTTLTAVAIRVSTYAYLLA